MLFFIFARPVLTTAYNHVERHGIWLCLTCLVGDRLTESNEIYSLYYYLPESTKKSNTTSQGYLVPEFCLITVPEGTITGYE